MTAAPHRTEPTARTGAVPFARLLRADVRKATDTRAARWLLLAAFAFSLLGAVIPIFPDSADQTLAFYVMTSSTGLNLLLPVVAILFVTAEWTQRTALTTFTLEPRRSRVLNAKLSVATALSVLASVATLVFAGACLWLAELSGRDTSWSLGPSKALGLFAAIVLGVLGAVAFGFLLQNTAAAVVALFAVPTVTGILGGVVGGATEWIDLGQTSTYLLDGDWDGHVGPILVSQLVWLVVPMVLGYRRTLRREVG